MFNPFVPNAPFSNPRRVKTKGCIGNERVNSIKKLYQGHNCSQYLEKFSQKNCIIKNYSENLHSSICFTIQLRIDELTFRANKVILVLKCFKRLFWFPWHLFCVLTNFWKVSGLIFNKLCTITNVMTYINKICFSLLLFPLGDCQYVTLLNRLKSFSNFWTEKSTCFQRSRNMVFRVVAARKTSQYPHPQENSWDGVLLQVKFLALGCLERY